MEHKPDQDATRPPPRDPRLEIPEILRERSAEPTKPGQDRTPVGSAIGEMGFALAIGIDFLVVAAAGGGAGWFVDHQFGSSPWGLLLGICAGFGGGLFRLIKRLEQKDRDEKRAKANRDAGPPRRSPVQPPDGPSKD